VGCLQRAKVLVHALPLRAKRRRNPTLATVNPTLCIILAMICQYFKEQLLSPDLPEALTSVTLRQEVLPTEGDNVDNNAMALADSMMVGNASDVTEEGWLFCTGIPTLPLSWYGSSILGAFFVHASALECWVIEQDGDTISKATCFIENETARSVVVFCETIVMEDNGSGRCNVTKTLDLRVVCQVWAMELFRDEGRMRVN
jgi:hypothetical protein